MMISSGQWRLNNCLTNHSGVILNSESAVAVCGKLKIEGSRSLQEQNE